MHSITYLVTLSRLRNSHKILDLLLLRTLQNCEYTDPLLALILLGPASDFIWVYPKKLRTKSKEGPREIRKKTQDGFQ